MGVAGPSGYAPVLRGSPSDRRWGGGIRRNKHRNKGLNSSNSRTTRRHGALGTLDFVEEPAAEGGPSNGGRDGGLEVELTIIGADEENDLVEAREEKDEGHDTATQGAAELAPSLASTHSAAAAAQVLRGGPLRAAKGSGTRAATSASAAAEVLRGGFSPGGSTGAAKEPDVSSEDDESEVIVANPAVQAINRRLKGKLSTEAASIAQKRLAAAAVLRGAPPPS